ncbi:MAG: hypothetical protein P8H95_05465, partial [Paracoccaceae bacterium]|nr:hypothetical protein [Paracoccaceae bacterium]
LYGLGQPQDLPIRSWPHFAQRAFLDLPGKRIWAFPNIAKTIITIKKITTILIIIRDQTVKMRRVLPSIRQPH